jgi:ferredoxin-type protein NapH
MAPAPPPDAVGDMTMARMLPLSMPTVQKLRRGTQAGFFLLFLVAPAFNWLRFDLNEAQLWFLGMRWSLGIDALRAGQIDATQAGLNLVWRALVPLLLLVMGFLWVAYRYGRVYCGWLCPHFSFVETLNHILHRACGKLSVWDSHTVFRPGVTPNRAWWPLFVISCLVAAFTWAITLLTYLLPPATIWGGLLHGTLTPNQIRFLVVGTVVFFVEFALARHLFCRFGCAVGLFQSLVWMANPHALVVAFDRGQARDCKTCQRELGTNPASGNACDSHCPMRLKPRNIKRRMFSCVQCGQCLQACNTTQQAQSRQPNLTWKVGVDALRETLKQRNADAQKDRA